jgi:hypothetical protein
MYLLSVLAQDEEMQRKGCVGIFMNLNLFWRSVEPADISNLTNLMMNFGPIRYVGFHICNDLPQQSMVSNVETLVSSKPRFTYSRVRFHSGT